MPDKLDNPKVCQKTNILMTPKQHREQAESYRLQGDPLNLAEHHDRLARMIEKKQAQRIH